jgi:hypothetical protein
LETPAALRSPFTFAAILRALVEGKSGLVRPMDRLYLFRRGEQ